MRSRLSAGPSLCRPLVLIIAVLAAPACVAGASSPPAVAAVDAARAADAGQEPGNWLLHGRTYDEQRYSPLSQIDRGNVARLGLGWEYRLDSLRGIEATPIVVDGVMYTTGTWSRVYALDAASGALLWQYDPHVPRKWGRKLCCDIVNRGVAVWAGRIYVGTLDGRLVAIDAATGERAWEVDTLVDRSLPYSITGAPRIVKGRVVIGNGGAEYGVRGYVSAYDATTGEWAWRFFTVPGAPGAPLESVELEKAQATWDPRRDPANGGGGTVWDSLAYDPALDLLYVGTGNGGPWARHKRSPAGGDNLYLASIVALDPDSGRMVWYYQTTPGDNWDFTATQHMILADIEIGGEIRKVLMQAPKNGFFYVLDRTDGTLISAEKFVYVNWASRVDAVTGRPLETGLGDYKDQARYVFPSPAGAHDWQPMSFSPRTGLVYIPAREIGWVFNDGDDYWFTYGVRDLQPLIGEQPVPATAGYVKAWDPVAQRPVWEMRLPNVWNGGTLATAGDLVFFGTATGQLYAVDAASGRILKTIEIGTGIIAAPVSYLAGGKQYVAVMAGWGGPAFNTMQGDEAALRYLNTGRALAFRLDGGEVPLPPPVPPRGEFPEPPVLEATSEQVERGRKLYVGHCGACHGMYGSTPLLPDLRRLTPAKHALFEAIVYAGMLEGNGMAGFSDLLSRDDVRAVHAYVVQLQREARAQRAGAD
ncbi:MAG: PQQ-dependent dehydrogenase, methanol/ethanol family [Gammaproteobacteria bacterium]|nr:PQQ-dependent dehydrogenase, methanol/ethanol family [Gammaproteobacteria bacterium]